MAKTSKEKDINEFYNGQNFLRTRTYCDKLLLVLLVDKKVDMK